MQRRLLWAIALAVIAVLLSTSARAEAAMYWGGTIKGDVYQESGEAPGNPAVLAKFEQHAGKQVSFINTGQSWVSFDAPRLQATVNAGAVPLVTMGLEPEVTLADVAEGKQDSRIRAWARAAKAWGYPFLFRPWWEMNGNWYSWGRKAEFVAAWRHFHDLVLQEGATNVTWAWVISAIWSDPISDPTPYYPGADYVDWVGMDSYNWGTNQLQPDAWRTPEALIEPTLEVFEKVAPGKPVCICEVGSTEIGGDKAKWITELLTKYLPGEPAIKAMLWFNWNIEQNGGRWDWPIESSAKAESAFRDGIRSDEYWAATPTLRPLTKVPLSFEQPPPPPAAAPIADLPSDGPPPRASPRLIGKVRFGQPSLNRQTGTAKVTLTLSEPGSLKLVGTKALVRVSRPPSRPARRSLALPTASGTVVLSLKPSKAARRELAEDGAARVAVAVTFTVGETATSKRLQLALRES